VQIVGYEPGVPDAPASLEIAEEGVVRTRLLEPGDRLAYGLTNRHCAGTVEEGVHRTCTRSGAPYCDQHTSIWACARCRGDCAMPLETCHEDHVVYLAAFEPRTAKVGVTRDWRLERRLAEQGASRGVRIRAVENGRLARQIEADIAETIPDRIAVDTKIDGLADDLDIAWWEDAVDPYDPDRELTFDYALEVEQRPIRATMATGTVRGTRGRLLLLERGETPYAVDLKDLVGYELLRGGGDPDRQASLGSF
jgi:hypothetical protein